VIAEFVLMGAAQEAQGWTALYNGPADRDESPAGMLRDGAGNLYVAGTSTQANGSTDILLLKYSASGTLLWERLFDGSAGGDDVATGLALDGVGNCVVVGTSKPVLDTDIIVLKYDPAGTLLWQRTFVGIPSSDDSPSAVAIDPSDRIVVCGSTWSLSNAYDVLLLQYAPDGTLNWQTQLDGHFHGTDDPTAMAMKSSGNFVVVSVSVGPDFSSDIGVWFCTSAGSLTVSHLYSAIPDEDAWPLAVALDPSGNALVTGFTDIGYGSTDCVTLKFTSAGTLAWVRTFDGPLYGFDVGAAVATDASGNVYVAGATQDAQGESDFLTLKYTPTGFLTWSQIHAGPGNGVDEAGGLVPDGSGGVIVAGTSDTPGRGLDIATLAYDAAGTLVGLTLHYGSALDADLPGGLVATGLPYVAVAGVSAETGAGDDIVVTNFDATAGITGVDPAEYPTEILLEPLLPNPLHESGTVRFHLPRAASVSLDVLDPAGRVVRRLLSAEHHPPGIHAHVFTWDRSGSGLFFLRLVVSDEYGATTHVRKVVCLR